MNSKIILKKEDFKRFKKCLKIAWTLKSLNNLKIVKEWVKTKKISVFFNLKNNNFKKNKKEKYLFFPYLYNFLLKKNWWLTSIDKINIINNNKKLINSNEININNFDINFYYSELIIDGNKVGKYARKYFMRNYNCFNFENYSKKNNFIKTVEILSNKNYDVYFEPYFIYNNCIAKCDILKKLPNGTFHLIEVKASNGKKYNKNTQMYIDSNIKDEYGYDVAYQYYILTGLGIIISKVSLMLLNSKYSYINYIDYDKLFIFQDFYKLKTKFFPAISLLEFCKQMITGIFAKRITNNQIISNDLYLIKYYFSQSIKNVFSLFINEKCLNKRGDLYGYCKHVTKYLPKHHSVFELTEGKEKKTLLKYQENINLIKNINLPFNFKQLTKKNKKILFSEKQKRQILSVQNNAPIINPKKFFLIKKILMKYNYPLYMYDFETFKTAIPCFNYSYPYQQIPFQYSVHIIKDNKFNYKNEKTIKHYDFLSDGNCDPRLSLIKHLVVDLFNYGIGVYVAYYKSFECKILNELIDYLKILINKSYNRKNKIIYKEWQKKINIIKNKTIDLIDFFKNFIIYKKEFYGSISIKNILPAFDNKFNYKTLKIKKGDIASKVFRNRIENNISINVWKKIFRTEMLKYCNYDTLSMVVIYKHIIFLTKNFNNVFKKIKKNEKI